MLINSVVVAQQCEVVTGSSITLSRTSGCKLPSLRLMTSQRSAAIGQRRHRTVQWEGERERKREPVS